MCCYLTRFLFIFFYEDLLRFAVWQKRINESSVIPEMSLERALVLNFKMYFISVVSCCSSVAEDGVNDRCPLV